MPWDYRPWGCGSGSKGSCNTGWVQFEICEDGLKGCTDYKKAARIIKDGGYATGLTYVEKLCSIIERWNLTQYDAKDSGGDEVIRWYRVRKSWTDSKSQKGAYKIDVRKIDFTIG